MICQYLADNRGAYSYRCRPEGTLFYLHRYFLTGRPAANIALAVQAALLTVFWLCTANMRREFTKVFTTFTVIPMTISAGLLAFHTAVILAMDFPSMKLIDALSVSEKILETTTCFTFMVGSTIFSAIVTHVFRRRTTPTGYAGISIVHSMLLIFVFVLSTLETFPLNFLDLDLSRFSILVFLGLLCTSAAAMVMLIATILIMAILDVWWWNKRNPNYSNDPVVYNAFSRMFWTIPLMIVSGLASSIDYVSNLSFDPYLSTISKSILPSCILIAMFILLPGYRTALFCCFANNRLKNRVHPTMMVLPSPAPQTSVPRQALAP